METGSGDKASQKWERFTKLCWWAPAQDSLVVDFCKETSIHGLKFLGEDKLHLTERIFWFFGFCCSLATAIYLIYGMIERHENVPVIVTFHSNEQSLDTVPFPAVTICDMNQISKKRVLLLQKNATDPTLTVEERRHALKNLKFIKHTCKVRKSFAKQTGFAFKRGTFEETTFDNETIDNIEFDRADSTDLTIANTIPCDQLIRLCMFGKKIRNCSDLFKPYFTNYGSCCMFNLIPLPLFLRNPIDPDETDPYKNPAFGTVDVRKLVSEEELDLWKQWNYDKGFVLNKSASRPHRQKRAGLQYGLSILLDSDMDDYYCPQADSMGVRYLLHTPIEAAHFSEYSSAVELGKEVFVNVHPEMTFADEDIRSVLPHKRKCHFGKEKRLRFFKPYTRSSCIDECYVDTMQNSCNCVPYYMLRDGGVRMCDNDRNSTDEQCKEAVLMNLQSNFKDSCPECLPLCEDITYNHETTTAALQHSKILWGDPDPSVQETTPEWANHSLALLHIFFGAESTVPKYRNRMYGFVDLLANTGGILGLCLGFSILSGLEFVYFFSLRAFWKFWKKQENPQRQEAESSELQKSNYDIWPSGLFQRRSSKVIILNDVKVPAYSDRNTYSNKMYDSPFARFGKHIRDVENQ